MSMDSQDKQKQNKGSLIHSFGFAICGIRMAIKRERNLKIHLFIALIVVLLGLAFSISLTEWLFIVLAVGGMVSAEMMNSALERVVDLCTQEYHPLAKQAKDMAAGAVLLFALTSAVTGMLIFGPKVVDIFM